MKTMLEMPNDSIAQPETKTVKDWKQKVIEWHNRPTLHVIPHLPTNATPITQHANAFLDNLALLSNIVIEV